MFNFARFGNDLYTGKRSIDFIGRQKTWYAVSGVLIVLALVGVFARGLNFGIEFRGGSEFRVSSVSSTANYEQKADAAMSQAGIPGNIVATVIGGNSIRVETEAAGDKQDTAKAALASEFGVNADAVSASLIGPSWGASVSAKAIQGLVIFLIVVAIFMAIYFRTWKMAVAGLVALLHDLVITVGVYALFGFEITPSSMIGFLTILGYSLYDTVVVFDKVRENTAAALSSKRTTYGRPRTSPSTRHWSARSTRPSSRCCRSPRSCSSASPSSVRHAARPQPRAVRRHRGRAYSSIFIATPLLVDLRRNEPALKELDRVVAKSSSSASRKGTRTPVAAGVGGTRTATVDDVRADEPADEAADDEAPRVIVEGEDQSATRAEAPSARCTSGRSPSGPRQQPRRAPKSKR